MYRLYSRNLWRQGAARITEYVWIDPADTIIYQRVTVPFGFVQCTSGADLVGKTRRDLRGMGFTNKTPKGDAWQGSVGYLARGILG